MLQKYILYLSPSGKRRRITVVDGQPYYESTGKNSGTEKLWYPFIMIRGTQAINWKNIPHIISMRYNAKHFELQHAVFDAYHITKLETMMLDPIFVELPHIDHDRIPTKETFITACRLSGGIHYYHLRKEVNLTDEEIASANSAIEFEKEAELELTNPDQVNQWVIKQGSTFIQYLLGSSGNEKLEQVSNMLNDPLMKTIDDDCSAFRLEEKNIGEIKNGAKQEIISATTQGNSTAKINSTLFQFPLRAYQLVPPEDLKKAGELSKEAEQLLDEVLTALSAVEMYQYCETKRFDSHLCFKILSSAHLYHKLDNMQASLIDNCKSEVSIALFEKGKDFLSRLNTSALFAICKQTAKMHPEISICMLSTPELLLNKLNDPFLRLLFFLNPEIKKENERNKVNIPSQDNLEIKEKSDVGEQVQWKPW